MRSRNLKPGICDNEILGKADPFYTLLFERLWLMADREGRLEDRPLRIKAQAFPYRDGLDVEPMLVWLTENEFITRYEVNRKRYIQIVAFLKHQNPHKHEPSSSIPSMAAEAQPLAVDIQPFKEAARSSLIPDSNSNSNSNSNTLGASSLAERKLAPEVEMAVELRKLDVNVTSFHPTLDAWVRDGFTVAQVSEAVAVARKSKPAGNIPPNYIDPILREPQKPPKQRLGKFDRITAENGETKDVGFG